MGSSADEVTADGRPADDEAGYAASAHGTDATVVERADDPPRRRTASSPAPERIGRYAVLRRIGAGGMGVVYEAHDDRVDRRVALKLLRDRGGETERLRLVREAQALAKLSHPHVVQVFEVGTQDDCTYLVMELIDGTSLDRWLAAERRSVPRLLEVLVQAGEGLAAAHAAGLVHRDFKPGNVLVGADGRVRVLDFGLARASLTLDDEDTPISPTPVSPTPVSPTVWARDLTRVGALVGTPAYMSPEQLGTAPVTAASDQFAFCVVLYEALFRQHPFAESGSVHALLHAILEGSVRPPPAARDVPPALRAAVLRGLASDPRDRWPSMAALLHALRASPRRPGWTRWAAAAAVVVTTGTGGAWALVEHPGPATPEACAAAEAKLAEVWGPAQHAAIEQAFLATALPYAAQTWERVAPRLDEYGEAWRGTHALACDAGPRDAEALDRRMACLERLRGGLATQVQILEQADATVVEQAVSAVAGLRPPLECLDEHADEEAPPADDERAARYAALSAELERAVALARSGKHREALAVAEPLVEADAAPEHPLLHARARLIIGEILEQLGDYPQAEQQLEQAYFLARAGGHASVLRAAAERLVDVVGVNQQDHARGLEWARHAEAALEREANPVAEADLLVSMAALHREQEEYARALALSEQGLAIFRAQLPPDDLRISEALTNSGIILRQIGRNRDAAQRHEQALAIAETALGSAHPQVATVLGNLAAAYHAEGQREQAAATMERAIAIHERIAGPRSVTLGQPLSNLSVILTGVGRHEDAERAARRAVAILDESGAQPRSLCNALHNLASALNEGQRYEQALPVHRRALAVCEQAGVAGHLSFAHYVAGYGVTLDELGELEEAEVMLRGAAEVFEHTNEAVTERLMPVLQRMAKVSLARGRFAEARARAERWLVLEPKLPQAPHHLAAVHLIAARACWALGERARARDHAVEAAARAALLDDGARGRALRDDIAAWRSEHDPEARTP